MVNPSKTMARAIRQINISSAMTVLLIISAISMTVALFHFDESQIERKHWENIDKIQATLENELAFALQSPRRLGRFVYTTSTLVEEEFSALSERFRPALPLTIEDPMVGLGYMDLRSQGDLSFLLDQNQIVRSYSGDDVDPSFRDTFAQAVKIGGALIFPMHILDHPNSAQNQFIYSMVYPVLENSKFAKSASSNAVTNQFGVVYRGVSFVSIDLTRLIKLTEHLTENSFLGIKVEHPGRNEILRDLPDIDVPVKTFTIDVEQANLSFEFTTHSEVSILSFLGRHKLFLFVMVALFGVGQILVLSIERSRRRAEELQVISDDANHQKSRFIATMSHEYRTPLNGILGMSQLISQEPLSNRQRMNLATMNRSAESLLAMVNDLLDLSKIEANGLEFDPCETDLSGLINQCITVANVSAISKNVELILDFSLDVPRHIIADKTRIQQIVTNLLSNAVKFTSEGSVSLKLAWDEDGAPDKGFLTITCQDTGIGIDENKMDHIFSAFSQADISTTRQFGGTGLGLTIVKELSELMGAEVSLDSKLGEGSTFTVVIPSIKHKKSTANRDLATVLNLRILTIGSQANPAACEIGALVRMGADVVEVDDIPGAIDLIKAAPTNANFDIALVDERASAGAEAALLKLPMKRILMRSSVYADKSRDLEENSPFDMAIVRPIFPEILAMRIATVFRSEINQQGVTSETETIEHPQEIEAPKTQNTPGESSDFQSSIQFGHHLLIVDDDATNRLYMEGLLENFGCSFKSVNNGQEAVTAMTKDGPFDLVMMDCQMPVMDGYEATRQITALIDAGSLPKTPIVAVTANVRDCDKQDCLTAGMESLIEKPIRISQVEHRLEILSAAKASASQSKPKPAPNVENQGAQIKEDVRPTKPAPAPKAPKITGPIDMEVYRGAAKNMGDRFERLLELFLKDGEVYSKQVVETAQNGSYKDCVRFAHTLKSTSKMVGALELAQSALKVETAAGDKAIGQDALVPLAQDVAESFQIARAQLVSLAA